MSSTLYRKYRPKKFSEIVGQKHIVRTLSNAIAHDRIGQAYLFTGPRGTGKTTIARIFAKAANCLDIRKTPGETVSSEPCLKCGNCKQFQEDKFTDIIEIDAASNTGVDNIRDLRETARLSPLRGKFKVYIIDEVHMLSQGAFNALLKILEEPPAHVIFILATTEIHKVPETIISRCQRFDFSKFTVEEIIEKLSAVAKKEKIKIDKEATGLIALMAEGGMRDAESLLEQIITLEKNDITSKKIEALLGVSGIKSIEKMTDLVFAGKTGEALIFVNKIYRDGYNLEIFSKSWLDYLRKMMLFKAGPELEKQIFSSLTKEQRESLKNLSARTGAKNLLVLIDRLSESIPKIKTSFIPQLPLEYLIVDLTGKSEEKNDFSGKSGGNDPDNDSEKKNGAEKSPKNYSSSADTEKKDISKKIEKEGAESKAVVKNPPIDINEIKKSWPEIIGEIGKHNYSLSMALSNSLLIENSDYGTIGIVVRHAFHKEILNKPENRLTIKNISNKITGLNFRVQAVTEAESGVKLKSIFTEDNIAQKDGIDDNSQGSLLADAMNLMGGTVVK